MRLQLLFLVFVLCAGPVVSQKAVFPLESVKVDGSSIPQAVILEIARLKTGGSVDKAGIEQACQRLQDSGLFESISYQYAPGPRGGIALTLALVDQGTFSATTIDIPGADENEVWQWLTARFPRFDHKLPQAGAAQEYLVRQVEQHLAENLKGQKLTLRMETDLKTRTMAFSLQPESLPVVQSVMFKGNRAVASLELGAVLNRVVTNQAYTDRRFAQAVELNLRPVYERHGLYRVQFAPGRPQLKDGRVSVEVAIVEGEPYRLGKVELAGEELPVGAMLSAAKLPTGKLANWQQIESGIWEMERVVKRRGFFEASVVPDRTYDDAGGVLNLLIRVTKGPLHLFGEVRFTGLSADVRERAVRTWRAKPGDPYDYAYSDDFFQELARTIDFGRFRKFEAVSEIQPADHVVNINVVFESR